MTPSPKLQVSVAMCTFNGARFIEEQLWSIFRQTYLPVELIVSDDNSTDETLAIVLRVYETACQEIEGVAQIKLLVLKNNEPLGVTKNFEQAISKCTSELVALCDQDDVWLEYRLEVMVNEFGKRPELLLLHHDSLLVDEELKPIGITTFQALRIGRREKERIHNGLASSVLLRRNVVTGATTIFRKKVFEESLPFPSSWLHDEWIAINASFLGRIDFKEETLIKYRQHSSNQVGVKKPGLRYLIARTFHPRTERNRILLTRSLELASKYKASSLPAARSVIEKLLHEEVRSNYPASRVLRIFPVISELISGRYNRFGLGMQDVLRDLIQSPN